MESGGVDACAEWDAVDKDFEHRVVDEYAYLGNPLVGYRRRPASGAGIDSRLLRGG